MKKIIVVLITLIMVVGCGKSEKASDVVKEYLDKYNNQNEAVMVDLEKIIKEENLSDNQAKVYKDIMIKQYKDLSYKIINETYNGDEANVTANIRVYDLYTAQKDAEEYKNNHRNEFIDNDRNYDANKFLDYKLEEMKKTTKTIEYTINFKVIKKDGKWVLDKVNTETLEKIHGIYNYTND